MKQKRVDERLKKQVRKKLKRKNVVSAQAGGDTVVVQQTTVTNVTQGVNNLDELNDVVLGDYPADGDVLTYDSVTEKWVNEQPTGGSGTPGGSNTQVQYNNAGAFGGISGATTDGTTLSVTTQSANDNSTKAASTAYADRLAYWRNPPTVTRVSDTQFTVPDVGNAGNWDKILSRLTVLKWTQSGTKMAMVTSSSYSSDVVTVNIAGDTFSAGFSDFKYTFEKALRDIFSYAGTTAILTDITRTWYSIGSNRIFAFRTFHKNAGTTNSTVYDINKNGSSVLTGGTISVSSGSTDSGFVKADSGTETTDGQYLTEDIDNISTTAAVDSYTYVFYFPTNKQYLT